MARRRQNDRGERGAPDVPFGENPELQLGFDMAPVLPRKKSQVPEVRDQRSDPSPVLGGSEIHSPTSDLRPPASALRSPISLPDSPLPTPNSQPVLTVAELTRRITDLLEVSIGSVWVEGEISNLRVQSSGHSYFTLKDASSQLSCVLFARTASGAGARLRDGLQVQLHGKISVYGPRGQYQLIVRIVQEKGVGVLQARFEELKARLAAEGLFAAERKRPLPRYPRRIGVVTSPTGAAIRDFLNVLHRRHPGIRVVISPVRVQGKGAAVEIAAAISELSAGGEVVGPVDVIVVTRGGGSLEDLWEFNEEAVARAIVSSSVPVVSAVGHEIDFTIADFAADFRAPTPSVAAEILAADGGEVLERCRSLVGRIGREAASLYAAHTARADLFFSSSLFREPARRIGEFGQTIDRAEEDLMSLTGGYLEDLNRRVSTSEILLSASRPDGKISEMRQRAGSLSAHLEHQLRHHLGRESGRLSGMETALSALSPEATLRRGFSITRDATGKVLTAASLLNKGDRIRTQLAEGIIESEVVQDRNLTG